MDQVHPGAAVVPALRPCRDGLQRPHVDSRRLRLAQPHATYRLGRSLVDGRRGCVRPHRCTREQRRAHSQVDRRFPRRDLGVREARWIHRPAAVRSGPAGRALLPAGRVRGWLHGQPGTAVQRRVDGEHAGPCACVPAPACRPGRKGPGRRASRPSAAPALAESWSQVTNATAWAGRYLVRSLTVTGLEVCSGVWLPASSSLVRGPLPGGSWRGP